MCEKCSTELEVSEWNEASLLQNSYFFSKMEKKIQKQH